MNNRFFLFRRFRTLSFIVLLVVITYVFMIVTEYDVSKSFTAIPKAIEWGTTNFYPNAASLEKLPDILLKLRETVLMSFASATLGALFALIFAIMGSETTKIHPILSRFTRMVATIFRNIDLSVWSMILLLSFSNSAYTGYFALFFGTFGFLTRAYTETIDEVSNSSVEALRATGASYLSIVSQSVLPSSLPQLMSWLLFMIENNIRNATLVGILTGTGIGFSFNLYYKSLNYPAASLVVVVIVIAVLAVEYSSNYVRRVMM
jgi:phosphonate transport system permease protein